MNRHLLSVAFVLSLFAACKSSDGDEPTNTAGAGSDEGGAESGGGASGGAKSGQAGDAAADGGSPEAGGGAGALGGSGDSAAGNSPGGAGDMSSAGGNSSSEAPACGIPETVVGSCAKKNLDGSIKSCAVYWGSAFTADALKTACPTEPTLGSNICPSEGSVGACEASSGPTALATYYYDAPDGTPANQAQCNANAGHMWCSP